MRLTRKQSQDQTRQRLIAAGQASIADEGVSATSIRHICEQAGHSQGAFYSNFATKDDLLLEIMRVHVESEVASLRAIIAEGDPNDPEGTMARFAGRLAELAAIPEWSLLSIELQLHAQRDPAFALRYNEYKAACHVEFARLVEDLLALNDLSPAMTPHQTGIALYALWSGLIVQGSVVGALPRDQVLLAFFRLGCLNA